jgi:protease YdgD
MGRKRQLWLGTAAALVAAAASGAATAAVFGTDDRVPVPIEMTATAEAVGALIHPRQRSICTAVCVAPNVIATAAHCVVGRSGVVPPLDEVTFLRGAARVQTRLAGGVKAKELIVAGTLAPSLTPPIGAAADWALARLARPVCTGHVLQLSPLSPEAIEAAAQVGRISQIALHRDRPPLQPLWSQPCTVGRSFGGLAWGAIAADFSAPAALLLHTCDTGGASSGSPLLDRGPDGVRMVGLNVGTYVSTRIVLREGREAERAQPETIANTAVAVSAFADRLAVLREAQFLTNEQQLGELRRRLSVRGRSPDDLRQAIEAFEHAQGWPVTGLATQALLRHLRGR